MYSVSFLLSKALGNGLPSWLGVELSVSVIA